MTIASIITAYDALGTLATTTATAFAAIAALGARPAFPVATTNDASYNTPSAAQVTYDAALIAANVAYNTAVTAQKVQEAVCTALMPQRQWITVTTLANWGAASTQYISWPMVSQTTVNSAKMFTINALTVIPVYAYPSLV